MPEEKDPQALVERLRVVAMSSYRAQRIRPPIAAWDAIDLSRIEVKSGEGSKDALTPKELAALQDRVRFGRGVGKFRRPEWVGKLSQSDARPHEILEKVVGQVIAQPTEETLRAAQLVLNDLGRTDRGQEFFKLIDQKLVDRFFKSQKER